MTTLKSTDASGIAQEFLTARRQAGSPAMDMVMTLVVVTDAAGSDGAFENARQASQEHPARLLQIVLGEAAGPARVDAVVTTGEGRSGEAAVIHLTGEVVNHADSVVVPLLLPDSPVVVWWPNNPPARPAQDPIGRLADRRITDAASAHGDHSRALARACRAYAPGNTDLTWTRLTPWRALLAAAIDQAGSPVSGAVVVGGRQSPATELMQAWLTDRLRVRVDRLNEDEDRLGSVTLTTERGDIKVRRLDESTAEFVVPGAVTRTVPLPRRPLADLLAEELRHLDEDDIFAETAARLVRMRDAVEAG